MEQRSPLIPTFPVLSWVIRLRDHSLHFLAQEWQVGWLLALCLLLSTLGVTSLALRYRHGRQRAFIHYLELRGIEEAEERFAYHRDVCQKRSLRSANIPKGAEVLNFDYRLFKRRLDAFYPCGSFTLEMERPGERRLAFLSLGYYVRQYAFHPRSWKADGRFYESFSRDHMGTILVFREDGLLLYRFQLHGWMYKHLLFSSSRGMLALYFDDERQRIYGRQLNQFKFEPRDRVGKDDAQ